MASDQEQSILSNQFSTSMAALGDTGTDQLLVSEVLQGSSPSAYPGGGLIHTSIVENDIHPNEMASDHQSNGDNNLGATTVAGVYDNSLFNYSDEEEEPTRFGIMPLHGMNDTSTAMMRASTAPGSVLSSGGTMVSSARTVLTVPRALGRYGRMLQRDDPWPGWNISTLPLWRQPASPANRLFGAIKETRPGTVPKALLERLNYIPQPRKIKSAATAAHLRLAVEGWNSSTLPSTPTYKKPQNSENTSVTENNSFAQKRFMQQIIGQTPSKKVSSLTAAIRPPSIVSQQWNISTTPNWKPAFKFNQFDYITDTKSSVAPAQSGNKYTSVKAQFLKPSKRHIQLKEERQLETQRRENYRQLDMKYYYTYNVRRSYRKLVT